MSNLDFLCVFQSLLAKQPPTAAGRPVDASPRVPGGSPRTPNRSVSSNVASVSPIPAGSKKIDPNMKAGATSEGVLANFFNSLLSKKTGSPGGPGVGGGPGGGAAGGGGGLPSSAKKSCLSHPFLEKQACNQTGKSPGPPLSSCPLSAQLTPTGDC